MDHTLVMARAYRGQPLELVALEEKHGLVYLADPALHEAVETGDSGAVGFPQRTFSPPIPCFFSV